METKSQTLFVFNRFLSTKTPKYSTYCSTIWLLLLGFSLSLQTIKAQVSGNIFRDYNSNGTKDNTSTFQEIGAANVVINAYNSAGIVIASFSSAANGAYSIPSSGPAYNGILGSNTGFIPSGTPVRLEFTNLQAGDYSSFSGGTSVQFATSPATGINFAVNYPWDYMQDNPSVVVPRYIQGYQLSGSTSGIPVFLKYQFNDTGIIGLPGYPIPNGITQANAMGATYGVAYHRKSASIFAGAYLRYASGFGPGGPGAIYKLDTVGNASVFLTLNAGTDPHPNAANFIITPGNPPLIAAQEVGTITGSLIGKIGLGDVDIDEETNTIYAINLFDKSIYQIPIGNSAVAPPLSNIISVPIPNSLPVGSPSLLGNVTGDDLRPFGIGIHLGKVYVGVMGTAESTSNPNDSWAWVLEYDPVAQAFASTPVISFSMKYTYPEASNTNSHGVPWSSNVLTVGELMFADIAFDNHDMILGFRERSPDRKDEPSFPTHGEILRFCYNAGAWSLVSAGSCGTNPSPSQLASNDDPSPAGEYYYDINPLFPFNELVTGALLQIPGRPVMATMSDPLNNLQTHGVVKLNNQTGMRIEGYELTFQLTEQYGFGKSTALGDIEAIAAPPPLEIGNRVWVDSNDNGIQDANEAGIDGITMEIYEGTTLVGTTTTSNGGQWYFNHTNINLGGATELQPNTAYTIRIPSAEIPSGQNLTVANIGGIGQTDVRDSDATLVNGNAEIAYNTGGCGQNDHTLDIGFRAAAAIPDISLAKNLLTPATGIAAIGDTAIFTLTVTNDNGLDATGVVVTDTLPLGVTFASATPALGVIHSNGVVTWTIGNFLGTDAPKTLEIAVAINPVATDNTTGEGVHINTAEITAMNETDEDSTPDNNVVGEDDQDQACFSVPVSLCSDSPTARIILTANIATSYQWYVSIDNGATYTALSGEINQGLTVDNALMGGNNVTKFFKVAYNGAAVTDECGDTMCCPVVVTTTACISCPIPRCIPVAIRRVVP